jgi:hypothetical protein
MDANKIASAYLNSLVHSPGSHLFSLDVEPQPGVVVADLSLWMEGFCCGEASTSMSEEQHTRLVREVFAWVELALQRYFDIAVPASELSPLNAKPQAMATAAPIPEDSQAKSGEQTRRWLGVPGLQLGFSAR